jgi:hypothetical protein
MIVAPAKAGVQGTPKDVARGWIPDSAAMTATALRAGARRLIRDFLCESPAFQDREIS